MSRKKLLTEFDGDGFVASVSVEWTIAPEPQVVLRLNTGAVVATVDLNPADLGCMCDLLESARTLAMEALARGRP